MKACSPDRQCQHRGIGWSSPSLEWQEHPWEVPLHLPEQVAAVSRSLLERVTGGYRTGSGVGTAQNLLEHLLEDQKEIWAEHRLICPWSSTVPRVGIKSTWRKVSL